MRLKAALENNPHTTQQNRRPYTDGIQRRTVLSREAEATRLPEGEKATDRMASWVREGGG